MLKVHFSEPFTSAGIVRLRGDPGNGGIDGVTTWTSEGDNISSGGCEGIHEREGGDSLEE